MKIYLWFSDKEEWKMIDATGKKLKKLLDERNIFISDSAEIGDYAKVGNSATIGDYAKIGDSATIGNSAEIGDLAKVGDFAKIGYSAKVGYSAEIGDSATIGDYAKIGDSAKIGNLAKIGNSATIEDNFNKDGKDTFTPLNIKIMTGIIMNNGVGLFYKSVNPDLISFHDKKYQYKIGKGDSDKKLERDQSTDCGLGWHWTNYDNAIVFARENSHKIISAEIRLEDILSVYNKVRVKAFKNVQEVKL